MILTPQETLVMGKRDYNAIISGLVRANTVNLLRPLSNSNGLVRAVTDVEEAIPMFTLPIGIRDTMGNELVCIDLRKSNREWKPSPFGNGFEPLALTEASFLTNLAIAQHVWKKNPAEYNMIYTDAARVYAMWIGMKIAKKLVLPLEIQNEMIAAFSYYWITRTFDHNVLTEQDYQYIVGRIGQMFGFNQNEVGHYLAKYNKAIHENIDEFCEALKNAVNNPKMKNFNRILLQAILMGSWGPSINGREMIAVAVEFPPMFMTMLYRGMQEKSFKNTDIVQLGTKLLNQQKQQQYQLIFSDILKRATSN